MKRKPYLRIFLLITLVFLCFITISAGSVSASHDSGAWGGPIYDWLADSEEADRNHDKVSDIDYARPDHESYGLSRPSQHYFSGGKLDTRTAIINEARRILANSEEKDSLEDLDESDGDPSTEEVIDALEYLDEETLRSNRSWRVRDYSFEEPPAEDIATWNRENYGEWFYPASGASEYPTNGSLIPEHRIEYTETMNSAGSSVLEDGDNWAIGLHTTIYSIDPSIWLMQDRDNETRGNTSNKVVTDNTEYMVGDSGTLRAVYSGQQADSPEDTLPDNPSEGDVGVQYTYDSLSVSEDNVDLNVRGHPIEAEIETVEYGTNERAAGTIYVDWENTDPDYSAGQQAVFELSTTFKIEYTATEYEYEYDIDPSLCEEDDDDEDEESGGDDDDEDTGYEPPPPPPVNPIGPGGVLAVGSGATGTPVNGISSGVTQNQVPSECPAELEKEKLTEWSITETETVTHNRTVRFASDLFMGEEEPEERFDVSRAELPNEPTQYHIDKQANSTLSSSFRGEPRFVEPISSVEIGATTAQTNWEYFGSRHHGWDDLVQRENDETKEELVERMKEHVYVVEEDNSWFGNTGGGVYASRTRPLEMYAYPKHKTPSDASGVVVDADETSVQPITEFSSPALLAHKRCRSQYPVPQNENYPWGNGYYNVESCGWMFTSAGQDTLPTKFHRATDDLNWREVPVGGGPRFYENMIKNESFHETYSDFSNNEEYYEGTYTMYDGMVVEKTTSQPDTVTINGVLGQEEEVSVGETYEVHNSNIVVRVERVSDPRNSSISVNEQPIYGQDRFVQISVELEGVKTESGVFSEQETDPINTQARGNEHLTIETGSSTNIASEDQYISQVQEVDVNTVENGGLNPDNQYVESSPGSYGQTMYLVPPNSMNAQVNISYDACHWTKVKDDACGNIDSDTPEMYVGATEEVETRDVQGEQIEPASFEQSLVVLLSGMLVITFIVNKFAQIFNKSFNPIRVIHDLIPDWVRTTLVIMFVLGIALDGFNPFYLFLALLLYSIVLKQGT